MELNNFNNEYKQLLEDLHNGYPDKNIILKDEPSNEYLDHFILNILPKIDNISVKNYDYFKYKCAEDELVKNFKFKYVFEGDYKENISIIWKYLQKLYIQVYNIDHIKKYITKFKSFINDYELLMLSLEQNNYNIYLDNFLKIDNRIKPKKSKKKKRKKKKTKKQVFNDPVISSDDENGNSMFPNLDNLDTDFIENSTIGKLAKEISEEIDPTKFEKMDNPSELFGSLFGGESSGNNDTKESFGDLMKTVCSKLDNKFKNGDIKQNDLLKEAQQMMGGLNLFDPGMLSKMMQGQGTNNDPRARKMKKKLNKKFKEKNKN